MFPRRGSLLLKDPGSENVADVLLASPERDMSMDGSFDKLSSCLYTEGHEPWIRRAKNAVLNTAVFVRSFCRDLACNEGPVSLYWEESGLYDDQVFIMM